MNFGLDLERVHALQIVRDIFQSVYLDASVKLLVEQNRHSLVESLIELEFSGNVALLGRLL